MDYARWERVGNLPLGRSYERPIIARREAFSRSKSNSRPIGVGLTRELTHSPAERNKNMGITEAVMLNMTRPAQTKTANSRSPASGLFGGGDTLRPDAKAAYKKWLGKQSGQQWHDCTLEDIFAAGAQWALRRAQNSKPPNDRGVQPTKADGKA